MRLIVTRPQPQADVWAADLQSAGFDALALPLIHIGPPLDPRPVQQAWLDLGGLRLLVFVSPAAVAGFMAARPVGGGRVDWPASTWAASPGPGTARALREAGLPACAVIEPAAEAEQFDSESLWAALQQHAALHAALQAARQAGGTGARVLIIGGSENEQPAGRSWLAAQLQAAGAQVDKLVAYRRAAPEPSRADLATLEAACMHPHEHWWLFSSSEAIDHLQTWLAASGAGLHAQSLQAVVTHPRIAQRARDAGFARVIESRPTLTDVMQALRHLQIHSPADTRVDEHLIHPTPSIQSGAT